MKMHTTKGANILREVTQLKEMIPGIEFTMNHSMDEATLTA